MKLFKPGKDYSMDDVKSGVKLGKFESECKLYIELLEASLAMLSNQQQGHTTNVPTFFFQLELDLKVESRSPTCDAGRKQEQERQMTAALQQQQLKAIMDMSRPITRTKL